jgi:hypothetical protein
MKPWELLIKILMKTWSTFSAYLQCIIIENH